MATNRLKMDAITLIAASRSSDHDMTETILGHYDEHAELARAIADVAALLAGTGAAKNAISGYLEYVGATNGHKIRTGSDARSRSEAT